MLHVCCSVNGFENCVRKDVLKLPVIDCSHKSRRLRQLRTLDKDVWEDAKLSDCMEWMKHR